MSDITNVEDLLYDPTAITHHLLNKIDSKNIVIPDITSPFMMLLEANAVLTSAAMNTMLRTHRQLFPHLANSKEDLFTHMHDYDYINMFAIPAEGRFIFLLNTLDIKQHGIEHDTYREVTIPATSVITVNDYKFTLLNDITVKLYSDNRVSIEQKLNEIVNDVINPISILDIGIIEGYIVKDTSGVEYITFETRIKQTHREVIEGTLIQGVGFTKEVILLDNEKYWWSEVYIKDNGVWKLLDITHSDIIFDKNKPTIWIRYVDNVVTYKLPNIYTDVLSGNIRIVLYTTRGEVNIPLDKYDINDFIIDLEDTSKDLSTSVSPHINIYCKSVYPCQGGVSNRSMETVRELVINDAIGNFQLPITEKQLTNDIKELGYDLTLETDIVTNRVFSASKNTLLSNTIDIGIKSKLNPMTIHYLLKEDVSNKYIIRNIKYNTIIIKSGSIFMLKDGVVVMVDDILRDTLLNSNNRTLPILLSKDRYFYNTHHIVINTDRSIVSTRLYNLNNPSIKNSRIISKNDYIKERVNSVAYSIVKTNDAYLLLFNVAGNVEFNTIPNKNIYGQLKFLINNVPVYYKGVCDPDKKTITFKIPTDFILDNDNKLLINEGISSIYEAWVELKNTIEFIIYTDIPTMINNTYKYNMEVVVDMDVNVIDVENVDVEFGHHVKYMWNRVLSNYEDRSVARYENDIPAFYKEDVYDLKEDGSHFDVNNDKLSYRIIHKKGDIVLDDEGKILNLHNKDDIIYGEDNLPITIDDSNINRLIDIPVIEYEFKVSNSNNYIEYYDRSMNTMNGWVKDDMILLNTKVLDNSTIYFKPNKSIDDIPVIINGYKNYIPHTCIPKVTLFITNNLQVTDDYLEDTIGLIIDEYLEKRVIKISELRELIIKELGNLVVGVKIQDITNIDDIEVFTIENNNRVNVKKKIEIGDDGKLITRYRVGVTIVNV